MSYKEKVDGYAINKELAFERIRLKWSTSTKLRTSADIPNAPSLTVHTKLEIWEE